MKLYLKAIIYKQLGYVIAICFLFSIISFAAFKNNKWVPAQEKNGGLILPGGFEAVVVVDSLEITSATRQPQYLLAMSVM